MMSAAKQTDACMSDRQARPPWVIVRLTGNRTSAYLTLLVLLAVSETRFNASALLPHISSHPGQCSDSSAATMHIRVGASALACMKGSSCT
jgi:hypothetical protein